MSSTEAVRQLMIDTAAIFAVVGNRIFPMRAPQGTPYPYCLYELQDGEPFRHLTGQSNIGHERITLSIWTKSYDEARTALEAIRDNLNGFRGAVDITGGGTTHLSCLWIEDYDISAEAPSDGSDEVIFNLDMDLLTAPAIPTTNPQ